MESHEEEFRENSEGKLRAKFTPVDGSNDRDRPTCTTRSSRPLPRPRSLVNPPPLPPRAMDCTLPPPPPPPPSSLGSLSLSRSPGESVAKLGGIEQDATESRSPSLGPKCGLRNSSCPCKGKGSTGRCGSLLWFLTLQGCLAYFLVATNTQYSISITRGEYGQICISEFLSQLHCLYLHL